MEPFTLADMREQFRFLMRTGCMNDLLSKLPGADSLTEDQMRQMPQNDDMVSMIAVIDSMTPGERVDPRAIHMQRRHRIARGSGSSVNSVGDVIKAHRRMNMQMRQLREHGLLGGSRRRRPPDVEFPPGRAP